MMWHLLQTGLNDSNLLAFNTLFISRQLGVPPSSNSIRGRPADEAEAIRLGYFSAMAAILARKSLQALRARQLVRTFLP